MARFGVQVGQQGWERFVVPGGARYRSPGTVFVEGDASSASYFPAAGRSAAGRCGWKAPADQHPGRRAFAEALEQLGARITLATTGSRPQPPAAAAEGLRPRPQPHPRRGDDAGGGGAVRRRPCRSRNIASWRVKETDRIAAMATELRKLGAEVEEGADYLRCSARRARSRRRSTPTTTTAWRCASRWRAWGPRVRINDPKCVNKDLPRLFRGLCAVARPVPVLAIDGPSASGKGTVARVAETLGWHYLDSGSLYRLVALAAMRAGVAFDDEAGAAAPPRVCQRASRAGGCCWERADRDVTDEIRSEACSVGASRSPCWAVRAPCSTASASSRPRLVAEGATWADLPDGQVFHSRLSEARRTPL